MQIYNILKQVREQRNFEIADVANASKISLSSLEKIESGEKDPSFNQIENLAKTYGVQPYLFYDANSPNIPEGLTDFRRTTPSPAKISPAGFRRIWTSEAIAGFANQLLEVTGYQRPPWTNEPLRGNISLERATKLRNFFDSWFSNKELGFGFLGSDEHCFLSGLRIFIELTGITININDAPPEDFIGFYNSNPNETPSIFVNRKIASKKAQLFTLVHELAHHLLDKDGISNPFRAKNQIERRCNEFAAEFIAPMESFQLLVEKHISRSNQNAIELINIISSKSLLSRYATAIRLKEAGYLKDADLKQWIKINSNLYFALREEKLEESESAGSGGQVHAKRLSELGYLPTYLAATAVRKKIIDRIDVQQGMFLAESIQDKAFSLAKRRVEVAEA
ncbi:XRE family transcriptional regulator [Methylobacterium sp. WL9]|uniref:helix-turn-helix domain-containing protein n=1 Tax=Methylobacterium sp. WL9 TaxID=2603898 RepID=UPI0011C8D60C|nr:XRE family transcriptional regulator [Methylobacterium sp. WL9]TXN22169.1 ImmA/IrrE family metallo-endopeptidase [Methylobacterium sp. WL9]